MIKFLWIEDQSFDGLQSLLSPVYVTGRYDPHIALDMTEGVRKLGETEYDAVIVDIRVPPGADAAWQRVYSERGRGAARERLGLRLLRALFDPRAGDSALVTRPSWLTPEKVGVLTVEGEIERGGGEPGLREQLRALNIRVYKQKRVRTAHTILLEMIEELTRRRV